jgi:hypothetical protein
MKAIAYQVAAYATDVLSYSTLSRAVREVGVTVVYFAISIDKATADMKESVELA